MTPVVVAKVGGSLFALPDLRDRLMNWVALLPDHRILFVPGGGRLADCICQLDQRHGLGEAKAHWLALRALSVNAYFLSDLLRLPVVSSLNELEGAFAVLDPHAFCMRDEDRAGALEHSWRVTSDSVAARVAAVVGGELVLLKSVDRPADLGPMLNGGRDVPELVSHSRFAVGQPAVGANSLFRNQRHEPGRRRVSTADPTHTAPRTLSEPVRSNGRRRISPQRPSGD